MEQAAAPGELGGIDPRRHYPDLRVDGLLLLGAAGLATGLYVVALLFRVLPPAGLNVVFFGSAPLFAGVALLVAGARARADGDSKLAWVCAGLAVSTAAMALQLIAYPLVDPEGGLFGTTGDSSAALYLWFHLALALGAVAGALDVPIPVRLPAAAVGIAMTLLFAANLIPLPVLLRPDASFSGLLVLLEYLLVGVMATATVLWVWREGRAAPVLHGWVGVALSLSTYDVLLNALAGERFTPVWWASLSLRVATFGVLAVGCILAVLARLRETESYTAAELDRREGQLRESIAITSRLLDSAEDLARAVTPAEVAQALCADAAKASGLPHASLLVASPGHDDLRLLGSAGYDSRMRAEVSDIGWESPHPGPVTLLRGRPVFLDSAAEILASFPAVARTPVRRAVTLAALPIRVGGEPVGALVLWDTRSRRLSATERQVLTGLAAQGGQALKRAQAFEDEAKTAAFLQQSLLPEQLPHRDGLRLTARYLAGERGLKVGGDWYDCIEIDDHRVGLVVGDVMGKGLRAATVMGQLRAAVRSLAIVNPSPAAVLAGLDRLAETMLRGDEIATLVYVLLDQRTGTALLARAGHLPPVLVDPVGHPELIIPGGSPPIGTPDSIRVEAELTMSPGSLLALYTDGIVEERATGLDRLENFVATVGTSAALNRADTAAIATQLVGPAVATDPGDDIALLLAWVTDLVDESGATAGRDPSSVRQALKPDPLDLGPDGAPTFTRNPGTGPAQTPARDHDLTATC